MDLGEFGAARVVERAIEDGTPVEPDTFRFHGEQFEVPANLSSLVLMEFAHDSQAYDTARKTAQARVDQAQRDADTATNPTARAAAEAEVSAAQVSLNEAMASTLSAMYRYVRACIGDGQWDRFRAVVLADGVDEDELMLVCGALFSAVAGRPTRRPSASPDGPSSTGDGSTDVSGSPAATPGPGPVVMGEVVQMPTLTDRTPAQRQAAEFDALLVDVGSLTQSSG